MAKLSIVIPTLGRSDALRRVLDGLAAETAQDIEVLLVIDAAAEAGAGAGPAEHKAMTRVLRAPVAGASGARNAGWRSASAPLILFLDDDIVPSRGLVAEHLAMHERHPQREVGVVGRVKWSPRVKVTPFMRWLELGIQFDYGTIKSTELEWQRFYSCNASVKREMLELVGGFDEERFPYGYEDLELAKRMSAHGFRLLYSRAALGEHLKSETIDSWRRNLRRIAVAERRYTKLHPDEMAYFYERFRGAHIAPPAQGRLARLAPWVRPRFPVLGRYVWASYDVSCSQRLAPEYLAEWDAAAAAGE